MDLILWILLGVLAGSLSFYTQHRTVLLLRPNVGRKFQAAVLGGAFLRWLLAAVVITAGLLESGRAGLGVFAGLWFSRWAALLLFSRRSLETAEDHSAGRS